MLGVRRMPAWVPMTLACLAVGFVLAGSFSIPGLWPHRDAVHTSDLAALPRPTSGWAQVSAGVDHTCGVRADGTAWCWGSNAHGQLGDGSKRSSRVPVQVEGVPAYDPDTEMGSDASATWTQISAGSANTCAVRSDQTAWCWGANRYGQLGTPRLSGDAACGIGGSDQIDCFGPDQASPQQVVTSSGDRLLLVTIDTADRAGCGLDEGSVAWCWGWTQPGVDSDAARLEGQEYHFDQIATDGAHGCGVEPDHRLRCWGSSAFGELGNGTAAAPNYLLARVGTATDWAVVSPGTRFTCGLRSPGSAWCWGVNDRGQLGMGNLSPRVAPARVGDAGNWGTVESGGSHVCGIRSPGSLWCWGEDHDGQLGIGKTSYRKSPTRLGTGSSWVQVSSGDRHSCAVTVDGTAWCWGSNGSGQVGDGTTTTTRWHPTKVRFTR